MSHPPGPPHEGGPTPQRPYSGTGAEPGQPGQPGSGDQPGQGRFYPPPQYGQHGQYRPYGTGPGSLPSNNGKATASLITGISSLVLFWCCGLGIGGVVAVVLGVKARREIRDSGGFQTGDGMALAGIVTGALAILFGIATVVLVVGLIATGSGDIETGTPYRRSY